MDLESECSVHESVEDNQIPLDPERSSLDDHNEIRDNGFASRTDISELSDNLVGDTEVKVGENALVVNSPPLDSRLSDDGTAPTQKGHGLRKWRRIKRDFVNDASASAIVNGKMLKRGSTGPGQPNKPQNSFLDVKHESHDLVGLENVMKPMEAVDGFSIHGSGSDSRFALEDGFAAGTDSENSEDRSSKSSTAASAPKVRYDPPIAVGHVMGERNKTKTVGGKNFGNSAQRVQQAKGKTESSKKHRGVRIKIEKENSHSSLESDSRSSNFLFMQGAAVSSNGKHSGRPMSFNGENSDEAHASERHFSEEAETGYNEQKLENVEHLLQENLAANVSWGAKSQTNQFTADQDPLVVSMLSLQSVQESLEKELHKFKEIGKDFISQRDNSLEGGGISDDFTNQGIHESKSSALLGTSSETQVLSFSQHVKVLESNLVASSTTLEGKDSKIAELEAMINASKFSKEGSGSTVGLQEEKCRELMNEIEYLFKKKIEAEFEYLVIRSTVQRLKVVVRNQTLLFEEQEVVVEEQAQMLSKLGELESKAINLDKQAKELQKYNGDILETEEVLVMKRRVGKVVCYFLIQMLLVLVFWCFTYQRLSSSSGEFVPT